jgi:hypothetical protein
MFLPLRLLTRTWTGGRRMCVPSGRASCTVDAAVCRRGSALPSVVDDHHVGHVDRRFTVMMPPDCARRTCLDPRPSCGASTRVDTLLTMTRSLSTQHRDRRVPHGVLAPCR